jgi:hypothetical protein
LIECRFYFFLVGFLGGFFGFFWVGLLGGFFNANLELYYLSNVKGVYI